MKKKKKKRVSECQGEGGERERTADSRQSAAQLVD
jgi:hypothetical protein